jgi:hypothetical protein
MTDYMSLVEPPLSQPNSEQAKSVASRFR